ncbi:uncharacterized protein PGTG_11799 [Puccinia graminis f. sp. tritici CRL 75-36-700-3]|uniref:Uncharacterized protein n=1 Tax=Puccinia graminis f. sp. tritici (strain CRL 75-36-700-3 / race SCCL) TaxID=418459 RepID=E3KMB8_PUCGT|nr:uncharacterized protein PGTG_11799 [Puccinia graminis f. sp. tritici CRL 75-36-700-3]EFP85443.2 hypothetical protein PGTG_11799 [Puccinia graminis f. sp. tritici CRL 75-36-700-3]
MDWKLGWRIVASDWARWPGSHHADGQARAQSLFCDPEAERHRKMHQPDAPPAT